MSTPENENVSSPEKILFRLKEDPNQEYPPVDIEGLWATPTRDGFRIDNVPFFVRGISNGDEVTANLKGDELFFDRVIAYSGHSTVRVLFYASDSRDELRKQLKVLGCSSELSHIADLISVDIPPGVDYNKVVTVLAKGEKDGLWEYEEGAIAHTD